MHAVCIEHRLSLALWLTVVLIAGFTSGCDETLAVFGDTKNELTTILTNHVGDTTLLICLLDGTYTGFTTAYITFDDPGREVTIRGGNSTVLDGESSSKCFADLNDGILILDRLTFTGFQSSVAPNRIATSSGPLTFLNCVFVYLQSQQGLVLADASSLITFDGCQFTTVTGGVGEGSIARVGFTAGLVLQNCILDGVSGGDGGSIIDVSGALEFLNNNVSNTIVSEEGIIKASGGAVVEIANSTFTNCRSQADVAVLFVDSSDVYVYSTVINGTYANGDGGVAGVFGSGFVLMQGCTIGNNFELSAGPLFEMTGSGLLSLNSSYVANSVATPYVFWAYSGGRLSMSNSLILNTTTTNAAINMLNGAELHVVNSAIIGNTKAIHCSSGYVTVNAGSVFCANQIGSTSTTCTESLAISIDGDDSCDDFCAASSACVPYFDAITTEGRCSADSRAPTFCRSCYICDVDECELEADDCLSGELCVDVARGWNCSVTDQCGDDSHNCDALANCTDFSGSFTCTCPSGYNTTNGGVNCTEVNECATGVHNCDAVAGCGNTIGSFTCACPAGYNSTDGGVSCVDVDECGSGVHNCGPLASCANSVGSFVCSCPVGYNTSDGGASCVDVNECSGGGSHNCHLLAACGNSPGSFGCACISGYSTANAGVNCSDVDECGAGSHGCDPVANCSNTIGSYGCSCPTGYNTTDGGVTCDDIDECDSIGCALGYNCYNTAGSFVCSIINVGVNVTASGSSTSEDGVSVEVTVALTSQPTASVTLPFSVSDSSEAILAPSALAFTNSTWSVPQTVVVSGIDDSLADGDVAYSVVVETIASADSLYAILTVPDVSLTNLDNDVATVGVTLAGAARNGTVGVNERANTTATTGSDGDELTVRVRLSAGPLSVVAVPVSVSDSTAVSLSAHVVYIGPANWTTPANITITGVDNDVASGDVAVTVTVGPATGAAAFVGASANIGFVVWDDDSAGVVLSGGTYTSEDGNTTTVLVTLTSEPTAPVNVTLASSDTTEGVVDGSGVVALDSSNWNTGANVTVVGMDDTDLDFLQLYNVHCSATASSGTVYASLDCSAASVTVPNIDNDDNGLVQVSAASNSLYEASPATIVSVFLVLTANPGGSGVTVSTVSTDTSEVTVATGSSLAFTPTNYYIPQKVSLSVVNDAVDDGDSVTALNIQADGIPSSLRVVYVTAVDDDAAGLSASTPAGNTDELGGDTTFSLVLTSQPTGTVSVTATSQDTTEGRVRTATQSLSFTASNWNTAQTVSVVGVRDNDNGDGDVSYDVRLVSTSGADSNYNGLATATTLVNENVVWPEVTSILESELSVLLGWEMTFRGTGFSAGAQPYIGGEPCLNVTRISSRELAFISPVQQKTGYYDYAVVNPDGGSYSGPNTIYYTDDCPFPGQFGRGLDCVDCPEGGICPGGYRVWPEPGYWNPGEDAGYVIPCDPPERCEGGPQSKCAKGYEGRLCAACSEGYYAEGKYCLKCASAGVSVFLFIIDIGMYIAFVAAAFFMPNTYFHGAVYTLTLLQLVRVIGRMNVGGLPQFMINFYRLLGLATGEGVRQAGCAAGSSLFIPSFFLSYSFVLSVVFILLAVFPLVRMGLQKWGWKLFTRDYLVELTAFYAQRQVSSLVVFGSFVYVNLATLNIQSLHCRRVESGERVLVIDNTVTCFEDGHTFCFVVGLLGFLAFTIGFPVGMGVFLVLNRDRLWDESIMGRVGFWYKDIKPEFFLQQIVWMLILLANAVSLVLLSSVPLAQLLLNTSLLLGFLAYVCICRPFKHLWRTVVLACILVVAVFGLIYNFVAQLDNPSRGGLRFLQVIILLGASAVFVVLTLRVVLLIQRSLFPNMVGPAPAESVYDKSIEDGSETDRGACSGSSSVRSNDRDDARLLSSSVSNNDGDATCVLKPVAAHPHPHPLDDVELSDSSQSSEGYSYSLGSRGGGGESVSGSCASEDERSAPDGTTGRRSHSVELDKLRQG